MSKAILVMEMPENCIVCPLSTGSDECIMQDEDANFRADSFDKLKEGCPLVQMPEKKMELVRQDFFMGEVMQGILVPVPENKGWNACINAIEGRMGHEEHR